MDIWSRSWRITKLTFDVMKKDKELFLFPILSFIFSMLFVIGLLLPTVIVKLFSGLGIEVFGVLEYVLLFVSYLGLAFIAVFFNVCVVYTAKMRFEGGDSKFKEAIGFAFSKIHLIFAWSLVSATVGLIFRLIDNFAERLGKWGELAVRILNSILGMIWSVITIFVVPVMVYENIGPFKAIKKSFYTLKKTWGESLIRYLSMGFIQFLILIPGLIIGILMIALGFGLGIFVLGAIGIILLAIYIIGVSLIFTIAASIYNTALYVYASTGKVPAGYDDESMRQAFKSKKISTQPSYFEQGQL